MNTVIVSTKAFRQDFPKYQKLVEKGVSITIVKRSKPIFKIEPVDAEFDHRLLEALMDYEKEKNFVPYNELFGT
jgi:antitoxin (DNA-binding transcriptional repressor) of toxin-antitoxin stability system